MPILCLDLVYRCRDLTVCEHEEGARGGSVQQILAGREIDANCGAIDSAYRVVRDYVAASLKAAVVFRRSLVCWVGVDFGAGAIHHLI